LAYQLFDIENKELFHHDLQDKSRWCRDGERIEEAFVRIFGDQLNLVINPEKKTNPFAPELLNIKTKNIGDLKFQSTPFFKAKTLYQIDPTYAVVFNLKDKNRYEQYYPNINIYYWINWIAIRFVVGSNIVNVEPLYGVWQVDFADFKEYLRTCPVHSYQQRVDDTKGNAKSSFVCDIRNEIFTRIV